MGTAAQVIAEPYFPIQFSSGRRSKISRVPDAFYIDHVKSIGRWKTEKNCIHKVHTTATCLRHSPGSLEFTVPKMTEKMVPKGTKTYTKTQKVYRRYTTQKPKGIQISVLKVSTQSDQNLLGHVVRHHQRQGKAKSCNKGFQHLS